MRIAIIRLSAFGDVVISSKLIAGIKMLDKSNTIDFSLMRDLVVLLKILLILTQFIRLILKSY